MCLEADFVLILVFERALIQALSQFSILLKQKHIKNTKLFSSRQFFNCCCNNNNIIINTNNNTRGEFLTELKARFKTNRRWKQNEKKFTRKKKIKNPFLFSVLLLFAAQHTTFDMSQKTVIIFVRPRLEEQGGYVRTAKFDELISFGVYILDSLLLPRARCKILL